ELSADLADTDQPHRYRGLAPDVRREIQNNVAGTLSRRISATLGFWLGYKQVNLFEKFESWSESEIWLVNNWPAISYATLLVMLGLGILGWRWSYPWAYDARLITLAVVFCFLPYFLSHVAGGQGSRLPLDGILLTFAALALARWRKAPTPATA